MKGRKREENKNEGRKKKKLKALNIRLRDPIKEWKK